MDQLRCQHNMVKGVGIAKKGFGLLGKKKVDKGESRISEINKILKKTDSKNKQNVYETYIDEVYEIYKGKK